MSEQKMKKKRTAADYSLIGSLISVGLPAIFGIIMLLNEKLITGPLGTDLAILWLLALLLSFFAGVIGLRESIRSKAKLNSYLKSGLGIMMGIFFIIIIFVAIPNFIQFNARAKQSEAKQNLRAIYDAYEVYHRRSHAYPSSPSIQVGDTVYNCFSIAGWAPKGQIRNNYNCMNTEVFSPSYRNYSCPGTYTHATKDSFTIAACGNLDNDTTVDVWTIDDAKHLRNVVDDVRK